MARKLMVVSLAVLLLVSVSGCCATLWRGAPPPGQRGDFDTALFFGQLGSLLGWVFIVVDLVSGALWLPKSASKN